MAIIPFGLIGTIWGHYVWDVPLSMFSVVGMIGMVGIIINDSIVLVTTVDEYAEDRGLFPAIVDAVADRLRPVFLTTATTVLGLFPLLYETSSQAQFLKPTVITLVYGLGVGMFLVLLVVPAFLAIGHDFSRQHRALRRAAFGRSNASRGVVTVAFVAIAAWFAATLGAQVLTASMIGPLGVLGGSVWAAFGLFVLGAAVIVLLTWIIAAIAVPHRRAA